MHEPQLDNTTMFLTVLVLATAIYLFLTVV